MPKLLRRNRTSWAKQSVYLTPDRDLTSDATEARRFTTRKDAEQYRNMLPGPGE